MLMSMVDFNYSVTKALFKMKSNEELRFVPEISMRIQFMLPSMWLSMMSTLSGLMEIVVCFIFVLAITETRVSMYTSVKYVIINFEMLLSYLCNHITVYMQSSCVCDKW